MNLSEINWDFEASGTWPPPIKAGFILILCLLVMGGGYYYDTMDQLDQLDSLELKENELKATFASKQKKAVNLPEYVKQLEQIQDALGEMIKQMPTEEEVASLLVDISQTGLASGLEFRLFKPAPPVRKEFYSELPIDIQVVGHYDELGLFVSGLASLPRIVTVHNVAILPMEKSSAQLMVMDAVIKTYKEDTDTQSADTTDKKKRKGAKK
ncbi:MULTISPECIES: type 4a pilus biogenesis protein PilO [Methylomicrobium]|uniref:Tfp pilus assembly protein PilO n=1 Tax=Methylomicrobium album BG8 TaxID=686340 RepID=H8GJM4_METAL|nr:MULTISPECIES: type 4a pilus biogenesis protein PilO [Methylomicrobium]EIC30384.1 Tfp pilus assembly protein PilO [Methylomicrobium album BG8]